MPNRHNHIEHMISASDADVENGHIKIRLVSTFAGTIVAIVFHGVAVVINRISILRSIGIDFSIPGIQSLADVENNPPGEQFFNYVSWISVLPIPISIGI